MNFICLVKLKKPVSIQNGLILFVMLAAQTQLKFILIAVAVTYILHYNFYVLCQKQMLT